MSDLICCYCSQPNGSIHAPGCIYCLGSIIAPKVFPHECNKPITRPEARFPDVDFKLEIASDYDERFRGKPRLSLTLYGQTEQEVQAHYEAALERLGWK